MFKQGHLVQPRWEVGTQDVVSRVNPFLGQHRDSILTLLPRKGSYTTTRFRRRFGRGHFPLAPDVVLNTRIMLVDSEVSRQRLSVHVERFLVRPLTMEGTFRGRVIFETSSVGAIRFPAFPFLRKGGNPGLVDVTGKRSHPDGGARRVLVGRQLVHEMLERIVVRRR